MAEKFVESVPNISEGRREEVVERVIEALMSVDGVYLLDASSDSDHNRSVITFAGAPEAAAEAAFRLAKEAARLIDLNRHEGGHPRMGATDVLPFVPLSGASMDDCVDLARRVGRRIGDELRIPIYLYERAATRPERRNLADVRRGQFEGLREAIGGDPERSPDFGPERIHPTAGATAVGARQFLIAYNVNLQSEDVHLARRIAGTIREKGGGLPGVKAMGLYLAEQRCAQVSMNLVDFTRTGIERVYGEIEKLAAEAGVEVRESELIGLMPQAAYTDGLEERVKLRDFTPESVVETRLARMRAAGLRRWRED